MLRLSYLFVVLVLLSACSAATRFSMQLDMLLFVPENLHTRTIQLAERQRLRLPAAPGYAVTDLGLPAEGYTGLRALELDLVGDFSSTRDSELELRFYLNEAGSAYAGSDPLVRVVSLSAGESKTVDLGFQLSETENADLFRRLSLGEFRLGLELRSSARRGTLSYSLERFTLRLKFASYSLSPY